MPAADRVNEMSKDAKEEIDHLREQVEALMKERVSPALTQAAGKAREFADQAREKYEHESEALAEQVRKTPLAAVLLAVGIGYLLGRITR